VLLVLVQIWIVRDETYPAPASQFFRFAAATPSRGRKLAFKRASTLPDHPGTFVAISGSTS
jgi:hypothetical protein